MAVTVTVKMTAAQLDRIRECLHAFEPMADKALSEASERDDRAERLRWDKLSQAARHLLDVVFS